uniref:TSA: Wollemia nobilis Ref_Wollemi_Transcript_16030_2065 transcribed RNA sequence n=1 Tax=Wollemia nobilis TaxID=56998 RepID=A0A0C9QNL4_9CONI
MWSAFCSKFFNRWTVLVACVWIECCAGASYSFGIYSETIKTRFGYSQQELDTISVFKDVGECVGIISGLLYDRFPPWVVVLAGAAQNVGGYTVIWLLLTGRLPAPAMWQMCALLCLAVNGQTYNNTASIVTCVNNFSGNRGIVLGLMKGCLGLSSAILSRLWHVVAPGGNDSDGSSFLLVAAVAPTAVALSLMPMVYKTGPATPLAESASKTTPRLALASAPVVGLALFLMGCALWTPHSTQASRVELAAALMILALPLFVACNATSTSKSSALELLLPDHRDSDDDVAQPAIECGNLWGALCSFDFMLVLFTAGVALGSGFVAVNNLNQVATALGFPQQEVSVFVSLISTWQFLGRFGGGAFSDYLLTRFGVPRPLLTAAAGLVQSCGYLLVVAASYFPWALYLGSAVIGLSFGANWSLNPTTVSELFGLRHFGTLYNVVLIGNPVVSYVLSVWVAGYLYDRESGRQGGECKGSECFNLTFAILACVCMLAALASLLLCVRTRHLYQKLRN